MNAALLAVVLAVQSPRDIARVAWVPSPRTANATWVSDAGNHLGAAARDSINRIITALEAETSSEMAVVVVDSLSGMSEQVFALAVHRAWGVGKAGRDNGIVLLWAPNERATWISVGNGLEGVLPDRRTGRILDEHLVPAFRAGRFDDGMIATVTALAAAAREETDFVQGVRGVQGVRNDDDDDGPGALPAVLGGIGLIGAGVGGTVGYKRLKRRRPRKCAKCGTMMQLMDEQQDDEHLEDGAKAEERLRSIDWDVWVCPNDGEALLVPYRKLFSSYDDCPQCRRRTAKVTNTRTITPATTMSSGLAHVMHDCQHCGHSWTSTKVIPRISTSSGSSSSGGSRSGGSSFGGGSAGGGGAGRRY